MALTPSAAEVGETTADDNGPAEAAAAVLRAVTTIETDPKAWELVEDTEADGEAWVLLGDTVNVTGAEAWVPVEDIEADGDPWVPLGDAIRETEKEAATVEDLGEKIPDVSEVAGETVVEAEDGISKEAGKNKTENFILTNNLMSSDINSSILF